MLGRKWSWYGLLVAVAFAMTAVDVVYAQKDQSLSEVLTQLNGSIKGNLYENKLLGIRIKFPDSMEVESRAEAEENLKGGVELLRNGVVDQKRVDEMIRKERIVFWLSTKLDQDPIGSTLNLSIKKDETKEAIGPMVERSIKFFTEAGKFKLDKGATEMSLATLKVVTFTLVMEQEGTRLYSKVFSTRRNGYLMTFSIAYVNEKELSKMETVLKGIELF